MTIKNLNDEPILLNRHSKCWIETGTIKIIHPVNLTSLEENVLSMSKIARGLDDRNPIAKLAIQKSRTLINNLRQLKPLQTKRQRRWDNIGTAWKWLAGSPDAEDLRAINSTMNTLVKQNNDQVKINRMINSRIEDITKAINALIEQQAFENKILLQEYDSLTLLLYMDTTNKILEDIQDTIIRTKLSLPNNKLLGLSEILAIESILKDQGISVEFPEQALEYVEPKIASKSDFLLYILRVPKLQPYPSEVIRITPLIVNNSLIINLPKFIIRSKHNLYTTTTPESLIQRHQFIQPISDECVYQMISGKTSQCDAVEETKTFISLIADNKILLNNVHKTQLSSDCGPEDRTFTGNFIITFVNCTIRIANESFVSKNYEINNTEEIQGAFSSLLINRSLIVHHNISLIHNSMIANRKSMDYINLQQFHHRQWITGILGGLSTTSVIFIIIIIYILYFRQRKVIVKVRCSKLKGITSEKQDATQTESQATRKMNEDVHSLPPGGVTMSTK